MIDSRKLQSLRDRYANASGGDMFDPHFASVARSQFTSSDKREWPFAGIPTLLGAPCRPDAQELPDFGGLDLTPMLVLILLIIMQQAVLPYLYQLGVTAGIA